MQASTIRTGPHAKAQESAIRQTNSQQETKQNKKKSNVYWTTIVRNVSAVNLRNVGQQAPPLIVPLRFQL